MNRYKIAFSPVASKSIAKYKKSNPGQYKKLARLLDELMDHPKTGTGHPEPLKKGNSVTYSRRINLRDRLVYDIYEDTVTVLVLAIEGHYDNK